MVKLYVGTERVARDYIDAERMGVDGIHPDHVENYEPDETTLELVSVSTAHETPFGTVHVEFEGEGPEEELQMAEIHGVERESVSE